MIPCATIPEIFIARVNQSPDAPAFHYEDARRGWQSLSWSEYWRQAQRIAAAFSRLGLKAGDRLGILAPTSIEWELAHLATLLNRAVLVGLDIHDVVERLQRIITDAEIAVLLVKDRALLMQLSPGLLRRCRFIIVLEDDPAPVADIQLTGWRTLLQSHDTPHTPAPPLPDDPATLIYTSGTTGEPKGILYTHRQATLACAAIVNAFPQLAAGSRFICWLPLSNLFQRIMNLCAAAAGGITYLIGEPQRVMDYLGFVKPEVFIGVPRFYEKLHAGIQKKIARQPPWKQWLIRHALNIGQRRAAVLRAGGEPALALNLQHALADRLVLGNMRRVMGGRIQFMISGSAPIPVTLLEFFHGIGLLTLEAYGLSENIIPMAINRPAAFRFGSVGQILPGNEVIVTAEGELLVRGPGLFSGYYNDPQPARRFNSDGYYSTGDYGVIDEAGFLYLRGRKSELIKTSTGRRIAPAGIEAVLKTIPYVDHALVSGAGHKCLIALLVIDWRQMGQEDDLPPDELFKRYAGQIRRDLHDKSQHLARHEQPAGFIIVRNGFSIAGGELTPNLKLRRGAVEDKYHDAVATLYNEIGEPGSPGGALPLHSA